MTIIPKYHACENEDGSDPLADVPLSWIEADTEHDTDLPTIAARYAHWGWAVLPLHSPVNGGCSCSKGRDCPGPGKHPRTPNGSKDASCDPATVREWWTRWPTANIGVATGKASGLLVIDIDGACNLPTAIRDLPRTITATTGRGRHIYLRYPDGIETKNDTKIGGLPIDVRGNGGYVVAPGSVHASCKRYAWDIGPDDCELAEPTEELLEWLTQKPAPAPSKPITSPMPMRATGSNSARTSAYAKRAIDEEAAKIASATEGNRNNTINASAFALFQLVAGGVANEEDVASAVYEAAASTGLSDAEIRTTIESARKGGMANPRSIPDREQQQPSTSPQAENAPADGSGDAKTVEAADPTHLTDLGNAKRFAADHGHIVRFCFAWNKWLVWDGRRWKIDDSGYVMLLAKRTIMGLFAWAEKQLKLLANDDSPEAKAKAIAVKKVLDHAIKSQHVNRLKAMLDLARSEPGIAINPADMDRDPWLLNCLNGTIDLRTGTLRQHNQADCLTALCPTRYDPAAKCPIFMRTINGIFRGDDDLIRYKSRFLGYCLSGETREHVVPIAYGGGSNGKSLLLNLTIDILGKDYAGTFPPELLMDTKGNQHPTIKADLFGKRLMVGMETAEGGKLNEERVKALSGGDRIKARRCKEDFWEFEPTHKLILCTNHKPQVTGGDHGIWRRLAMVPYAATYWDADKGETGPGEMQADKTLPAKLRAEAEGILAWMVRGCLDWQRQGLAAPKSVLLATSEYKSDEDRLGSFLGERCTRNPEFRAKASEVYAAYKAWCESRGERYQNATAFGMAMGERGIVRDAGKRWYLGISLANEMD